MSDPSKNVKIRVSAPGKVILHGEHSVVYGKLALAASLGLRTRLQYEESEGGNVRVEFSGMDLITHYDVKDIQSLLDRPLPLLHSSDDIAHPDAINHQELLDTVTCFIKDKTEHYDRLNPKQVQALSAFFWLFFAILDLTISAGTGSSASFAVTIAAFLIQYVKVKNLQMKELFDNCTLDKFDKNDLDLISKWAFQAERIIHGTPSGVDNTVCTYGAMVEFYKGVRPKLVDLTTRFKVILINTNIPRDTKAQVEKVAKLRNKHKTMVEGILSLMDETASSALDYIRKINGVENENNNVKQYYETLGELAEINQNLLRCLNVSHPKLEEACQILHEKGLRGKLTGAGGGGFAIALVPPYIPEAAVEKVVEELNSKGFNAVLTDLGGSGVSVD